MTTVYPDQLDTNITLYKVTDGVSPVKAADHNQLQEAIVAIEAEVGANPSGTFGTVKDRLDDMDGRVSDIGDILNNGNITIGAAEDGSYADGLYPDFTTATPIGTAVDRFNEVLLNLVPPPAPDLSTIGFDSSLGIQGNVSFGTSHSVSGYANVAGTAGGSVLDINGLITATAGTAVRKGLYDDNVSLGGNIADTIAVDPTLPNPAYPAKSFGDADLGTLELWVNGSLVKSVDLTTFASGSSLSAGLSGFTSLSAATSAQFANGTSFSNFKYRTGRWVVSATDQRNGHNFVQVKHISGDFTRVTNFFDWVVDGNNTATAFSSASMGTPSMAGSKFISGVKYHTSGSATYAITISNAFRNTYSSSSTALTFPDATNVSISSSSIGPITAETDAISLSRSATINAVRLLNGSISTDVAVDRTLQGDLTSSASSQTGILMDSVSDGSTATVEPLDGEVFRVPSNRSLTLTSGFTLGGAALWTATLSLTSGGAGYNDGLLVHGGSLYYPNNASVANSGNFSTITNGPAGNVNYSGATGTRVYWRYFFYSTVAQNFTINVTQSGVTFIAAASSLGTSNGNAHCEILAPNTTSSGVAVEFKDAVTAYTTDNAIGCFASSYGATIPTSWGITLGSRSTATSGSAIIMKITVGQGWTGRIDNISVTSV